MLNDIEKLRENLMKLIEEKGSNLQDPDVIAASQILNAAITKYNEFIRNKL
ncbi:aspartyl-phosphate phosphatase Spo0E family protein [Proteiniborus sp. MB09-C3]|uniref:aspartyl-phosphate phosphatase Spo0E family protein n=1 Tax=Proteiniborus sp. MB09-C3 TaxID=3050072 RepID=UPI002552727B|nr:aspartyl-phosphate phosphatase Spo0E family protein [Proteiniborus sp. MB09-C3]WIV10650.1 aspartyl-phosphate phosphatase Spo0E family protein [Proteiniborus sp. MB09-C3]